MPLDDLTEVELQDIMENNKYLTRKAFDVSTILVDGKIPEFDRDVDSLMCALDVAEFIKRNGISNHNKLALYLNSLKSEHKVALLQKIDKNTLETMAANKTYSNIMDEIDAELV